MAFVNLSLLFGTLLIAAPIALHLAMRPQPKRVVFPALRFLQKRGESNSRQLRLRHWILLALRCLAIAAFAAALARPSVASDAVGDWLTTGATGLLAALVGGIGAVAAARGRSRRLVGALLGVAALLAVGAGGMTLRVLAGGSAVRIGDEEAAVSAVLVVDTAPRMEYRFENRTRLEAARETAAWLVGQLPADSQIGVVDPRPGPDAFSVDAAAARQAIDRLQPVATARPLPEAIRRGLRLVAGGTQSRKELYVLTDLTRAAWPASDAESLQRELAERADVLVYVVDVGAPRPNNFSLGELQLSAEILPRGGLLELQGEVACVGAGGPKQIELQIDALDPTRPVLQDGKPLWPESLPRGRQQVELPADGAAKFEFRLGGLELGVHHGRLRLAGEDGLASDDVRHFTVQVADAWPVLVVAPPGVATRYFVEAVSPLEFRQSGRTRFDCQTIAQAALASTDLERFAAVCLLDPQPLPPTEWERLARYVETGGGLALLLGHNAEATDAFRHPAARRLLGGRLARQWRAPDGDLFLAPRQLDHPVLREFRSIASGVPWNDFPVYRYWSFDPLDPTARVVVPYGDNQPAIVETTLGKGRALTSTTPFSDPARPSGRSPWNLLPTAPDAWPFVVLADQMLQHLVGVGDGRLNLTAGQTAVLPQLPSVDPPRYELFTPSGDLEELSPADGAWTVRFTEQPGAYRLKGFREQPVRRGFSVNLPAERQDLRRLDREELDRRLGAGRYQFATTREEIDRGVGEARRGREFYPLLMLGLALVLGLEQLLANRFYRATEPARPAAAREAAA